MSATGTGAHASGAVDLDDLTFDRDHSDPHLHAATAAPAFVATANGAAAPPALRPAAQPAPMGQGHSTYQPRAAAPAAATGVAAEERPSIASFRQHSMELAAIASRPQQMPTSAAVAPAAADTGAAAAAPVAAAETAPAPVAVAAVAPAAAPAPAPAPAVSVEVKAEAKKAPVIATPKTPVNPHAAALSAIEWHYATVDEAAAKLGASVNAKQPRASVGLTSEEAAKRLQMYGLNQLTPPPVTPDWLRYLKQYTDPLLMLVLVAAILSLIAYGVDTSESLNLWLAIVLLVVAFISSTFGYIQEGKASEVMSTFKTMLAAKAKVIRNGQSIEIDASLIVPGDVVLLKSGDASPADLRMFYSGDLKCDLSSLTGESVPITSITGPVKAGTRVEEARNLVFNTSQCMEGEGMGMVIATGDSSLIGRIAALASDAGHTKSPLQVEIEHLVYRLTAVAVCTGLVFFVIGMSRGRKFLDAFVNCFIIVILAWVPQGLPMTVVSCLSLTARSLAEKSVFVKELKSVETLGSCTVIASDKTGTLTQNKMTLVHLWYDLNATSEVQALREPVAPAGPLQYHHALSTMAWIDVCACMCNRTQFADQRALKDDEATQLEAAHALSSLDPTLTLRSATNAFPLIGVIRNDMTLRSLKKKFEVPDDSKRAVTGGDASDTAIFNFVKKRVSPELMRHRYEAVYDVPFSSRTKFALQIVKPRARTPKTDLAALAGGNGGIL